MRYSKKTIICFRKPKFVGEIKNPDGVGVVGNPRCGDMMKVSLRIRKGVIKEIKFLTYGCIAAIACSEILCRLAKGKKIEDALKITSKEIIKELGGLPPLKIHCSLLGKEALKKAIKEYKKKEHKKKHKKKKTP